MCCWLLIAEDDIVTCAAAADKLAANCKLSSLMYTHLLLVTSHYWVFIEKMQVFFNISFKLA